MNKKFKATLLANENGRKFIKKWIASEITNVIETPAERSWFYLIDASNQIYSIGKKGTKTGSALFGDKVHINKLISQGITKLVQEGEVKCYLKGDSPEFYTIQKILS
jgi:hypothetical protein